MEETMTASPIRLLTIALMAAAIVGAGEGRAQDVVFMSTQLRPLEEAQKLRDVILKGFPGKVTFVTEEPAPLAIRMKAEAGTHTVSVAGPGRGDLHPPPAINPLDAVAEVAAQLASRGIPASLMQLG